MAVINRNSIVFALFSILFLKNICFALVSQSNAGTVQINRSAIKYANDEKWNTSQKDTQPAMTRKADVAVTVSGVKGPFIDRYGSGSIRGTLNRDQSVRRQDKWAYEDVDEFDEPGEVDEPNENDFDQSELSFRQTMSQVSGNGKVIVTTVLTCDTPNYKQSLSQISDSRVLSYNSFNDNNAKRYLNTRLYKQGPARVITSDAYESDILQSASQCSGSAITQAARIVLDCPSWCQQKISVKQYVSQTSSSVFSQIMELYVVCPKGVKPQVICNQNTSQSSARIKRNFKAYALYRV